MTVRALLLRIAQQEDLNFLFTNRLPRRWLTLLMGRLSKVEQPLIRDACLAIWRLFGELDLSEARSSHFRSLHECFTRQLKDGARRIDPDPAVVVSPCDGIVGALGEVNSGAVLQAKGFPYTLMDLLGDAELVRAYLKGSFVTLRLTSGMYHRFHAPYDCQVEQVTYVSGDTWNVNPIALQRIENLFCKNERAIIRCRLPSGHLIPLVPVAAILVASIRLHCVDVLLHLRYRGPNQLPCAARLRKGEEMGWFQHGSTIIAFAPPGVSLAAELRSGARVSMGQPLLRLADG
ncbi:MAG TPA: archaetidylserine decarboxylase [Candidatus Dormibacteraeota bacterium]|nr:archaetidylserine decarboxylase [Candidatus Dormibacteraeota bacterium]